MSSATYFSTVVSQTGLNFVKTTYPTGPLIDLAYFVPVYDYRIDSTIQDDGVALSAFSDVAYQIVNTSATSAFGEYLWYLRDGTQYSLTGPNALTSAIAGTYDGVSRIYYTNQTAKPTIGVNFHTNHTLSNTVSATNLDYDSSTNSWQVSGFSNLTGNNSKPNVTELDNYYKVVDYHPVYENGEDSSLRGSFTCRINANNGKYKFNKIVFYCVRRNEDGTLYGGDGTLTYFGEAFVQEPIIKSSFSSNGIDDIVCNVQFNISTVTSAFSNVFYSTSGDYWQRSLGGLHYPMKVSIGEFDDLHKDPEASLHVRKPRTSATNTIDYSIPNLRLDYDANRYLDLSITSGAEGYGDLEISINGWSTFCERNFTIKPTVDKTIGLGTSENGFRQLYVDNYYEHAIDINKGQVKIGKLGGSNQTESYSIPSLYISASAVVIDNDVNLYGAFKGGDVWREEEELLIYNTFCGTGFRNLAIVAGVDNYGTFPSVGGQTGMTNRNMSQLFFTSGDFKSTLLDDSYVHIAAKGGIKAHGVLEIENIRDDYSTYTYNGATILTRDKDFIIAAGVVSTVTYDEINEYLLDGGDFDDLTLSNCSNILLISENVYTNGNIIPLKHNNNNVGTPSYRYYNMYSNRIDIDYSTEDIDALVTYSSLTTDYYIGGMKITRLIGRTGSNSLQGYTTLDARSNRNISGKTLTEFKPNMLVNSLNVEDDLVTNDIECNNVADINTLVAATTLLTNVEATNGYNERSRTNTLGTWVLFDDSNVYMAGSIGGSNPDNQAVNLSISNSAIRFTVIGDTIIIYFELHGGTDNVGIPTGIKRVLLRLSGIVISQFSRGYQANGTATMYAYNQTSDGYPYTLAVNAISASNSGIGYTDFYIEPQYKYESFITSPIDITMNSGNTRPSIVGHIIGKLESTTLF